MTFAQNILLHLREYTSWNDAEILAKTQSFLLARLNRDIAEAIAALAKSSR
jgi:hypothetical protein